MQSRRMSLLEQCVSVAIGFAVAMAIQIILMPALGIPTTHGQDLIIVLVFTVASIIRGYAVRRLFNWWAHIRAERDFNLWLKDGKNG